jgi:predicted NACHT family NTPase
MEAIKEQWERDPEPILRAGRAMLLLDGLDELPGARLSSIQTEIEALLRDETQCRVLVTCRIAAREYVSERFNEIEIDEFTPQQVSHFASHWFPARGHPEKVAPFLRAMREQAGLRELTTNPLLLTMICLYFEDHADFTVSRAELYAKGLDTILERWDASRGIKRDDSPTVDFLRRLGNRCILL